MNVFSIVISLMHLHMTSQTYCRSSYGIDKRSSTELIKDLGGLLLKNFCKTSLWKFVVMRSHITSKSGFGQIDPTTGVPNMFKLLCFRGWGQVLFPKYSFHTGVFDSPCFKFFTAFVDHFYDDRFTVICPQSPMFILSAPWLFFTTSLKSFRGFIKTQL